jgi:hypothetical protein
MWCLGLIIVSMVKKCADYALGHFYPSRLLLTLNITCSVNNYYSNRFPDFFRTHYINWLTFLKIIESLQTMTKMSVGNWSKIARYCEQRCCLNNILETVRNLCSRTRHKVHSFNIYGTLNGSIWNYSEHRKRGTELKFCLIIFLQLGF